MSFDIVVLQPNPDTELLASIEQVAEAFPLGTPEEIRRQCDLVFPGVRWSASSGIYQAPEGFAIEFSVPDETHPSPLNLTLHLGDRWKAGGSDAFDQLIGALYKINRWQSFAVSDNSSLVLAGTK